MTFNDTLNKLMLDGMQIGEMDLKGSLIALLFSLLIGIYLFVVYRTFVRKTFYNINLNIALVGVVIVIAAIVLTIQVNLVLSLGMVGALSIVRFRTAIKDPMDLFFMFWAIAVGIMCGASQFILAFVVTILLTVVIFVLGQLPTAKAPYILVINGHQKGLETELKEILNAYCKHYKIKARNIVGDNVRMIVELKVSDEQGFLEEINGLKEIEKVSLLTYEGDVVC